MTAVGIVSFVVLLLLSVMLHEAGHFLTARHYGMKVTHFFVGFGPTLFSRRRGETEYGVKAIPAGGFVKIIGMTPLEEVSEADAPRALYRQPARARIVVLAAGSAVHFAIAVLLVLGVTLVVGVADDNAPVLSAPQACVATVLTESSVPPAGCPAGRTVPAPAALAGLRAGDRVRSVDGRPVSTYTGLVSAIRSHAGRPLTLGVERAGHPVVVQLTPTPVTRPDLQHPAVAVRVGAIGVGHQAVARHVGLLRSFRETGRDLGLIVTGTVKALTTKASSLGTLYGPHRDPAGFAGVVGIANVSGQVLSTDGVSLSLRIGEFLLLIAGLNLFVGVFNLLPLLPLDGGHIAVVLYEQARHRLRRLRGYRGEVQRVDFGKLIPVTYAVIFLFAALTLYIMGADIVNPIRLGQ